MAAGDELQTGGGAEKPQGQALSAPKHATPTGFLVTRVECLQTRDQRPYLCGKLRT